MTAADVEPRTTATAGGPVLAGGHSHGLRTGTPPERFTSRDPDAFAVPTGREEEWRFTPLRAIRPLLHPFEPTTEISATVEAPIGVTAESVPSADPRVGRVLQPADRVSALALARTPNAFVVVIPAGVALDEPVVVTGKATPGTTYAHLVIEAGAGSRATVVVEYTGSATVAENVEILVGDGAALEVVTVHNWDGDAIQLAAQSARIGRDGRLDVTSVNLGGKLVRLNPSVRFDGPGGLVRLHGVSFAGAGQHLETRLYVDHGAPECTSDVLYKNALQGEGARTVWIGDVRIRPAAIGTNTFELNRNLVLTDGARADSVPNLEIETGEIAGAGHASATGRFDDLQLFYLQARGIPETEARRLVVRGFFADVVERIAVPDLRERLMRAIESRLEEPA
ncbi:MAG: Fe-S cluster assembly protein SufD [Actinobacteria bacterium]|nr:Fe-S cluster assembly protein SufD [Actinomycetota bacterium]